MSEPAFDIGRLSPDQKLELIDQLWESLSARDREAIPLSPEHERELDRRLDALEIEGPAGLSPEELRKTVKRSAS